MSKNSSNTWLIVAIAIIAIAVILFLLWQKKESETPPETPPDYIPGDEDGDTDPPIEPGYRTLKFDHTTHDRQSITWWLSGNYFATVLSGTVRAGGLIEPTIDILVEHEGKWKKVGEVQGKEYFVSFEVTPNMNISAVKWKAQQGLLPGIGERFVDEVHATLWVEA